MQVKRGTNDTLLAANDCKKNEPVTNRHGLNYQMKSVLDCCSKGGGKLPPPLRN